MRDALRPQAGRLHSIELMRMLRYRAVENFARREHGLDEIAPARIRDFVGNGLEQLLTLESRGDGKELVVRSILARSKGRSAFVADRSSGLPLKGVVDLVLGFGAEEDAVPVRDPADVHVDNAALTAVLPYLIEEVRAEPVRQ